MSFNRHKKIKVEIIHLNVGRTEVLSVRAETLSRCRSKNKYSHKYSKNETEIV